MELKQSKILHVSVCGTWFRLQGRYKRYKKQGSISLCKYLLKGYASGAIYKSTRWWDNGAKHPARELDFITVEEWLLLN